MNSFERNHDSAKEDISWEEIKERDLDFKQTENDSDSFINDLELQEDFTHDLSNQIPVISYKEYKEEVGKDIEYINNTQDHAEDEEKWKEQELKSLQDEYLNYYDTVRIILTDYEYVNSNQSLLTNVVILLLLMFINIDLQIMLYFIFIYS